jgi:hypothetical protein
MHRSPQAPDQVGSRKGLARAGLELGDIDLFELNETFRCDGTQTAPTIRFADTNWSYRWPL